MTIQELVNVMEKHVKRFSVYYDEDALELDTSNPIIMAGIGRLTVDSVDPIPVDGGVTVYIHPAVKIL